MNKVTLIFWGLKNLYSDSRITDYSYYADIYKKIDDRNKYHPSYFNSVYVEEFCDVLKEINKNLITSKVTLIIGEQALSSYLHSGNDQNVIELILSFPEINILFSKWNENLFVSEGKVDNPQIYIEHKLLHDKLIHMLRCEPVIFS